jgi:hypothetical protein
MLQRIDRFGFIEVDGQAFYLHWSLAGEWAEVRSRRRGVQYAKTIVGKFRLSRPQAECMNRKKSASKKTVKTAGIINRIKNSFSQAAG